MLPPPPHCALAMLLPETIMQTSARTIKSLFLKVGVFLKN
jgi:hypothetical protein